MRLLLLIGALLDLGSFSLGCCMHWSPPDPWFYVGFDASRLLDPGSIAGVLFGWTATQYIKAVIRTRRDAKVAREALRQAENVIVHVASDFRCICTDSTICQRCLADKYIATHKLVDGARPEQPPALPYR